MKMADDTNNVETRSGIALLCKLKWATSLMQMVKATKENSSASKIVQKAQPFKKICLKTKIQKSEKLHDSTKNTHETKWSWVAASTLTEKLVH